MRCPDCNALVTPDLHGCPACRRPLRPAFAATSSVVEKYRRQIAESRDRWSRAGPLETEAEPASAASDGAALDVDTPGVLNLLLLHAGYSPLSRLGVRGGRPGSTNGASLRLSSDPAVFRVKTLPLSGGASWLEPPLVTPEADFFFSIDEAVSGEIEVALESQGRTLDRVRRPVSVHSANQWLLRPGCEAALAGMVTPNAAAVEEILRDLDEDLAGYQSASPERVGRQVAAVDEAVRALDLRYLGAAPSFAGDGQRVLFPEQAVSARRGSCVDHAVLTASLLERVGVHPLILLLRDDDRGWGHAISGVWTADIRARSPVLRDRQVIDRALGDGDLLVWDATPAPSAGRSGFSAALDAGRRLLRHFEFAIDVRASRDHGFQPLPTTPRLRRRVS